MSKEGIHNWWGIAWVEKIERLAQPDRFLDGERYARTGCVQSTVFDGKTLSARVLVPKEPSCIVHIVIEPFSTDQWNQLMLEIRDPSRLATALAAGDLPFEISTAFSKANLRFMPERYVDLRLECGCPDWLKPCCHMVAVWLKFARDFDRDPFLVFELRGLKREDLLALLENRAPSVASERVPEEELPDTAVTAHPEALPSDPAAFWSAPPLPDTQQDSAERPILDEDVFERLRDWPKLESQFSQVYDAVYELATRTRR